jgi:hypothetical protein
MSYDSAPFYAIELTVVLPSSGALTGLATWNSLTWNGVPWDALSLTAFSPGDTSTIRASDIGYRTLASDPDGVVSYPPVLIEAFQINRQVPLAPTDASAAYAWGTLRLANDDGRYDSIASAWNSDRRAISIYRGVKAMEDGTGYQRWIFIDPPYADLTPMFVGLAQPWFLGATDLQIPLRDATYWIETAVQSAQYAGTGTYDGTAALAGTRKPKTRGGTALNPVRNVTPTLIDPTNLIYQYTDGPGTVVNLYEGAALTIVFSSDTANLYAGSTTAGHYRTDNSRGLFQLGSQPAATITCDVTGSFPIAGAATGVISLARYLLTEDLALPAGNIDTASFIAAAVAYPYTAGIYFGSDDSPDGATAVGRVLASIGAKLIPSRTGELKCFVLRAIPGTATASDQFDITNLISLTPQPLPASISPPPYRLRCAYQHNYTVQTSDLNTATATAAQLQFVASSDRYAYWSDADIQLAYARPNDPAPFGGALLIQSQAQTVVDAEGALWGARTRLYAAVLPVSVGIERDIGDVVRLVYPMDDLRGGKLGQIVGEAFSSGEDTITLMVLV